MPVSRMRMRPWLEKMIDSKSISGLTWVDKEKTMFSIPWKHAARHGWEMDKDASLFKEWAIHTGKYMAGQACDPKTWKANFRCAMNSLPDIEEVKNRSINKGHQAVRIFRMLPATPKSREKRSKGKEAMLRRKTSMIKREEDTDFSDTQSPSAASLSEETTQENTVDSTVHTTQQDYALVNSPEVPDWSYSVDIGLSSNNRSFSSNISERFQVSPEHSPDYDSGEEIVEICQLLEKELQNDLRWMPNSIDNMGFLSNEPSPGSLWSDASSADELDEMPHYTTLDSGFTNLTDDLCLSPQFTLML